MNALRVRLGDLLIESGLLKQADLETALQKQKANGGRLGAVLIESGLVSETQVTQILSQQLSVPWVSLHHINFTRQLLNLVPVDFVEKYSLVPIYVRRVRGLGDALYLAMDDPTNEEAMLDIAKYSGLHVRAMIAPLSDIKAAIRVYYGVGEELPPTKVEGRGGRQSSGAPASVAIEVIESEPPDDRSVPVIPSEYPKPIGGAPLVAMTLNDGTTVELPKRTKMPSDKPEDDSADSEEQLTARDLISALRAVSHGADASEILGNEVRWESLFSALLSLLLKKQLIADWEFIEEYKKI